MGVELGDCPFQSNCLCLLAIEVNITGTLNVLIAARDNKVGKVIFFSSSAVYGDTPRSPESKDLAVSPKSPYAVTKLAGEHYCQVFQEVYHLPTVCLRYFNIYGTRQNPELEYAAVIPRFIDRALQDLSPVIYGDGGQTRDFTFVLDAVQSNIIACESGATGVFDIGTGVSTSVKKLAIAIAAVTGKELTPEYEESKAGDIRDSLADISRARRVMGYEPKYSLEDGLRETIRWFENAR